MNQFRSVGKGISLMHDSDSGATPTGNTPDMVKLLVPLLKDEGFTFVRVDEIPAIVAALPPSPCDASCTSCSGPAANQCTGCADGMYLSGGVCSDGCTKNADCLSNETCDLTSTKTDLGGNEVGTCRVKTLSEQESDACGDAGAKADGGDASTKDASTPKDAGRD